MTHWPILTVTYDLLHDPCDDAIKNKQRTIAIAHTVTQITLYSAKVQILSSICCRQLDIKHWNAKLMLSDKNATKFVTQLGLQNWASKCRRLQLYFNTSKFSSLQQFICCLGQEFVLVSLKDYWNSLHRFWEHHVTLSRNVLHWKQWSAFHTLLKRR